MTRGEIAAEIRRRNARITSIIDEITSHQAMIQRLMTERSVLEGEIRGFESARVTHRIPKAANDG